MTEVERYEKRGDNASSNGQKKGGKKSPQEAWMDLVASSVDVAPAHLKSQLSIIAGLDNVPRKEKQFRNFATNSLNLRGNNSRGANVVSEIWTLLKSRHQQAQEDRKKVEEQQALEKQSKNNNKTENGGKSELLSKEISESNATAQVSSENESSTESPGAAVDVETAEPMDKVVAPEIITEKTVRKAMKTVLKKSNSLSTKHLRKAVQRHIGASKSNKKAIKLMISQNLKNGNEKTSQTFILEGKTVSLGTNS